MLKTKTPPTLKKEFKGKFNENSHVLFCISDPDFSLMESRKRYNKDVNFCDDVELINSDKRIKQVTLCPTFLVSRWNILSDIIVLVDGSLKKNNKTTEKTLKEQIIAKLNEQKINNTSLSIIEHQACEVLKLFITTQEKWSQDHANKKEIKKQVTDELNKIASFLKPISLERELLWKKVHQEEIKKLPLEVKSPELSWEEFLQDIEAAKSRLLVLEKEGSFRRDIFNAKVGTSKTDRLNKKYHGSYAPIATHLIKLCVSAYVTEESLFEAWLQVYKKATFHVQIHDGSLARPLKYVLDHSVIGNSIECKVPFIEIGNNNDQNSNKLKPIQNNNNMNAEQKYLNIKIPYSSFPDNFFVKSPTLKDPIFDKELENDHSYKFVIRNGKWKAGFKIAWDQNKPKFDAAVELWEKIQTSKLEQDDGGILDYSYSSGLNTASLRIEITEQEPKHQLELFKKIITSLKEGLTKFLKKNNALNLHNESTLTKDVIYEKKFN